MDDTEVPSVSYSRMEVTNGDETPRPMKTSTAALGSPVELNPAAFLRQNRYLVITVAIVLVAFVTLTALFVTDKHAKDNEVLRLGNLAGENEQSIRELLQAQKRPLEELRNLTAEKLNPKIDKAEANLDDSIVKSLGKSRAKFERKIAAEVSGAHLRIDQIVYKVHSDLAAIDSASRAELGPALSNLEQMLKQALSQVADLINKSKSLVDPVRIRALGDSLKNATKSITDELAALKVEVLYGSVWTFDLGPLLANMSKDDDDLFTAPREVVVNGIPLVMRMNAFFFHYPSIYIYFDCYNDTEAPFKGPLQKSLVLTLLTDKNTAFLRDKISLSRMPRCQGKNDHWDHTFLGEESILRQKSVLVNNTIRLAFQLLDDFN